MISPLTGAWTVYGKAHFSGFELAVEEINKAGGVLGRPLEIVVGVHERVRLLGGTCEVTSRPDGPTEVSVVLSHWHPQSASATGEAGVR